MTPKAIINFGKRKWHFFFFFYWNFVIYFVCIQWMLLLMQNATVTRCNNGGVGLVASIWPDIQVDGGGVRPQQQQIWQVDLLPSQQQTSSSSSLWDRDDNHQNQHHGFINHGPSLIGLDYTNPGNTYRLLIVINQPCFRLYPWLSFFFFLLSTILPFTVMSSNVW